MKKYLIYLDILGFEPLAEKMAKNSGFDEDDIRQKYLSDPLKKKIEELKREKVEVTKGISEIEGSDNYVLIVDELQTAFEAIGKLTTIKIPHKDYGSIPFEVAMGAQEIDEDLQVDPINRRKIIDFLKNDIINPYRKYYENTHGGKIEETFVLLTQDVFEELEPFDTKYCERISYKNKTFFAANLESILQRCKVYEFLDKIGQKGSKFYDRIDDLYVPPVEYGEIRDALEKDRIVFITGTPEYGKTYTSVRFLWEYYKKGYEPGWVKGEEKTQRIMVRKRLEEIEGELKPNHIIYFEDPFGQTKYEKREGLEREIGTIIESVKRVNDAHVIITSREEVFKEFEKESLSAKNLKELEKKLNIKKPSYDHEKKEKILLKWAEKEDCKWFTDNRLKEIILESLEEDERILPTPLSIRDFVKASRDVTTKNELKETLKEKSGETARRFADEIKNMTDDKVLFLSFPFISNFFKIDFVKVLYKESKKSVEKLGIKDAWEFDRVFNWFKDDKISVGRHITFSHPSYSEALKYLLVDKDGFHTRINREIFSELLLILAENDKAAGHVAWTVAENFDMLPENVRNLLFELAEKDKAARDVAWAVAENFDKLPENVRDLLCELAEKDKAARGVVSAVAENFNKLPENVRNLLFKLAEKDETALDVARAIAVNFGMLPEDVRNELLFKLAEKDEAALDVARAVAENFGMLPEDVRNELLFKLAEKDEAARDVAQTVALNFNMLPENVRNELLFILAEKDKAAGDAASTVVLNFDKLPVDVRNELLFKLSEKDEAAEDVAWAVAENFNKLPDNVRNLLFKLAENGETARGVARVVAINFDMLPVDVRNELLFRLAEKDSAAVNVIGAIALNFDKLPEDVRNKLVLKLAETNGLQDQIRHLIEYLSHKNQIETIKLISKVRSKIDKDFTLKILNKLSKDKNGEVRTKAETLMNTMREDVKE